jgi:hypothetical protein
MKHFNIRRMFLFLSCIYVINLLVPINFSSCYANVTQDEWSIETIEQTIGIQDVGQYSSLTITNQNQLCVSYYDVYNSRLKYASYDGNNWQIDVIDNEGEVGQYSSLSITESGKKNIVYYDNLATSLKYAGWLSSFWQKEIETVEKTTGPFDVGQYSSLTLNDKNQLCVSLP